MIAFSAAGKPTYSGIWMITSTMSSVEASTFGDAHGRRRQAEIRDHSAGRTDEESPGRMLLSLTTVADRASGRPALRSHWPSSVRSFGARDGLGWFAITPTSR